MRIQLQHCEQVLLAEIGSREFTRGSVALTYALTLRSREKVNWKTVNQAIIERWSMSGLQWIKDAAWKRLSAGARRA